jgi:hypothetical protein
MSLISALLNFKELMVSGAVGRMRIGGFIKAKSLKGLS